ncbi:MAG: response regulator, partial [Candidatus Binatia bacterium]
MERTGTILVVDDLESNRFLLKEMLEGVGHRVLAAADGPQAIEIAAAEQPETILLD